MSSRYPLKILTGLGIALLAASFVDSQQFETVKQSDGEEEYAFRAPAIGVPDHILKLYCANVKLRFYWNVFRPEVKSTLRKGIFLRRMARFAKHVFTDVRSVDRPFNASRLSRIDDFFGVEDPLDTMDQLEEDENREEEKSDTLVSKRKLWTVRQMASKLTCKISRSHDCKKKHTEDNGLERDTETHYSEDWEMDSYSERLDKVKKWMKSYAKNFAMGIYTRWRTMWWLMMPCLFVKYYLWDPALDEFTKLQRALVMYPDLQTMKLQDSGCLPVKYFERILTTCKILNPLLVLNFGHMSLNKMTRFKGDT